MANDVVSRYVLKFSDLASKGMLGAAATAGKLTSSLKSVSSSLAGQVGIAATAYQAYRGAVDFQSIMTDIELKADGGAAAIAGLSDKIRKLANDSGRLPVDVAKGFDSLLGLGLDAKAAESMIAPIAKASTAYRAEIEELSRASFAVFDNLKVPASEAAKSLEIMASAGKAGKVELRDMAQYMPELTGAMNGLKQSGHEATATLASGLQIVGKTSGGAEQAAKSLNDLLVKIGSKETRKNFTKYGNIDIEKSTLRKMGEGKDIIQATVETIEDALKNGAKIGDLFGDKETLRAINALRPNMEEYRKIRDEAMASSGAVNQDFERRMQDFGPKMTKFLGSLQSISMDILGPMLDAVGPGLETIANFLSTNPDAAKWIAYFAAFAVGAKYVWGIVKAYKAMRAAAVAAAVAQAALNAIDGGGIDLPGKRGRRVRGGKAGAIAGAVAGIGLQVGAEYGINKALESTGKQVAKVGASSAVAAGVATKAAAKTAGTWAAVGTAARVAGPFVARIGLRFIPFVGWAMLAYDAVQLVQWALKDNSGASKFGKNTSAMRQNFNGNLELMWADALTFQSRIGGLNIAPIAPINFSNYQGALSKNPSPQNNTISIETKKGTSAYLNGSNTPIKNSLTLGR